MNANGLPTNNDARDRPALVPGVPLTMQDTASGGIADCAKSGGLTNDKRLYYSITLPPDRYAHIRLTPTAPVEQHGPTLRMLSDCDAPTYMTINRIQRPDGQTALCGLNTGTSDRTLVLAVNNYHGPTMQFDIVVELRNSWIDCIPSERFMF